MGSEYNFLSQCGIKLLLKYLTLYLVTIQYSKVKDSIWYNKLQYISYYIINVKYDNLCLIIIYQQILFLSV